MDGLGHKYEWFDDGYRENGSRPMNGYFLFLLACRRPNTKIYPGNPLGLTLEVGNTYSLVLGSVHMRMFTYRRVGAFKHVWGEERTCLDNPLLGYYLDFDPKNFERHTITIIWHFR